MKTTDFDYYLPPEKIAQTPLEPRDISKLLVYNRQIKTVEHRIFRDMTEYLCDGDVLIINDTKVIPARLFGEKLNTHGFIEFLLLNRREKDIWEILVRPGKRARIGSKFIFGDKLEAEIIDIIDEGQRVARFNYTGSFEAILDELGIMPLPPYIKEKLKDRERYNTVYAHESGSAAAPTAGLHFTYELMDKIKMMNVSIVPVTLHVGLGTFRPVSAKNIEDHNMHTEFYTISQKSADIINKAKEAGKRIISVGTTSTRVLESVADENGYLTAKSGWTNIFIYPGYRWKCVDALITNFHLPQSTLLMLVSSFIGRDQMLRIYDIAIKEDYRFFSFGDAMLLL